MKSISACVPSLLLIWTGVIASVTGAAEVPFAQVSIDKNPPTKPYYKMVGDLTGDGLVDIVVGGAHSTLVYYRYPDWKKTTISDGGGWDGVKGEICDVDGDGDADIAMGGVVWFANPGTVGGDWKMTRIDKERIHDVELADLDGDGRPDLVGRDQSAFGSNGNRIFLYRQETPHSWAKRTLDCPHGEGLRLGDIDRDGDPDILTGGIWYENTRDIAKGPWTAHRYTKAWQEPDAKVEMADINGDGRPDIVLTPAELRGETYKVAWYEAPSDPRKGNWKEHVIVPSIECVIHSLGVGDIDRDGNLDLAIAEMDQGANPDEVSIHFGRARGTKWRKQVISTRGSHDIVVADIGGDGDLDIVGANHSGRSVELWENKSPGK